MTAAAYESRIGARHARLSGTTKTISGSIFKQQVRVRLLAAWFARALLERSVPLDHRGSRECRMRAAPAVSCASCTKKCAHEHTGSAEAIRHSLRNGLTAYAVLSPASEFVLSPSLPA